MCFGFATNVALALHFQCIQLGKQRFAVTEYFTGLRVEINLVKDLLNGEVNHVKFYGDSFLAYSGIVYLDFCSDPTPPPICGPDALTPHSLLPGNYALTKSMELTKVQNSGTLWYTKKFLTLYYYIFLSNDIMTKTYQQKVIEIFDDFINSLPSEVQENAERYFYPENEAINFKYEHFNLFSNFASYNIFENQDERNSYYQSAKKYYFSLLMGSGGQSGVKKMLKEAVQEPGFVYSRKNIDNIILSAVIDVCIRTA